VDRPRATGGVLRERHQPRLRREHLEYKTAKATCKTVNATYKTVKATCKTVNATYKTVKATYTTVKTTYKTVKATYKHPAGVADADGQVVVSCTYTLHPTPYTLHPTLQGVASRV